MLRRVVRITLYSFAGLVVLLLVAYLFRNALFGRMLKHRIEAELSKAAGGRWSIHAIEGSWFGDLALVGLRLEEPAPHGPLARFSCGRAEARYDLAGLLGDDPLAAVKTIRVLTADVGIDLTRPAAPPAEKPEESGAVELPGLPDVEIDGRVTVRTAAEDFAAGRVTVRGSDVLVVALDELAIPQTPELTRVTATLRRLGPTRVGFAAEQEGLGPDAIEASEFGWSADGWTVDARVRAAGGLVTVKGDAARLVAAIKEPLDLARVPRLPEPAAGTVEGEVTVLDLGAVAARLSARGVRYGDVALDSLEAEGEWRDGAATITRLEARAPDGWATARALRVEPARPYYVAAAEQISVHVPDLRAFASDLGYEVRIDVEAGSPDGRALTITEARVQTVGASFVVDGTAALPVDPAAWKTTVVDLRFEGSVTDATRFAPDAPPLRGELTASGRVRGTLEAPVARLDVKGQDLELDGRAVRELTLAGDLDWPELRGMSLRVDAEAGHLLLAGRANLEQRILRDGRYEIDVPDLAQVAKLIPDAPRLAGRLTGKGEVAWDGSALAGRARLDGTDLVYGDVAVGTVNVRARVEWPRVEFEELTGRGTWGEVSGRGRLEWEERAARIEALDGRHGSYAGRLAEPLAVEWGDGHVVAKGLVAEVFGGTLRGDVLWTGRPEGALSFENLDVALLDARLQGRAFGAVRAGPAGYSLDVHVPELAAEGQRGGVDVVARYADGEGVVLEKLAVDAGDLLTLSGTATLPFRIDADGVERIEGVTPHADLEGSVRALSFPPHVSAKRATLKITGTERSLALVAAVRDVAAQGEVVFPGDTSLRLRITHDAASLVAVAPKSDFGELEAAIGADHGFDWTDPAAYRPAFAAAQVSGRVDMRVPDLRTLARLAPDLRHVEGRAEVHLAAKGPVRSPEVTGGATLMGVSVAAGGVLPPLENASGELSFAGRTVTIESVRGELGHEPVTLSGSVVLPGEGPPRFDLALKGDNLLLARDFYLRLRADVDVSVTGPLDGLVVKGAVGIRDAIYSRPVQLMVQGAPPTDGKLQLFSFRKGPLRTMEFDIAITGDRTFRVSNNVIRGEFSLDLKLVGTGEVPEPQGRVAFRDTLVKMPFSSLKVDRGEVRFPLDDPFAPALDVAAHTRMKGYDLDVQVSGEMPEVEVHVAARPTLSQEDAILLLTTGVTRGELEREGLTRTALVKIGTYFGQQLVSSAAGPSDPDERTLFDRFSFEIGRELSRTGKETMQGEFELTRRYYLRGERDRFDDYNMGIVWRYRFR